MKNLSYILTAVAMLLIIAGFIVPPMGSIDGSVLTGVGEIIGLQAVATIWHAIDKGVDAKVTHGDTTIDLKNDD